MRRWKLVVTTVNPRGEVQSFTHTFESRGVVTPSTNGSFIGWYTGSGFQIGYNMDSVLNYTMEEADVD